MTIAYIYIYIYIYMCIFEYCTCVYGWYACRHMYMLLGHGYYICINNYNYDVYSHSLVLTYSQHTLTGYSALPGLLMGRRLRQAVKPAR